MRQLRRVLLYGRVSLNFFFFAQMVEFMYTESWGTLRLGELRHGLRRNCARDEITVDCCRGQYNSSKIDG